MSTTVRISAELHDLLKTLARQSSTSMQEVLKVALERYRQDLFLDSLSQDFERAGGYQDELDSLEGTVADGLGTEP